MKRFLCIMVSGAALMFTFSSTPLRGAGGARRAAVGDLPLTAAQVSGWFNQGIGRPITSGNDVTELVDGFATFKSMSDVIKTTRPNLSVMYNLGAAAGDGLYPGVTGNIAEGLDHSIYFTTGQGGANNRGAFCKITPDGKYSILYSFDLVHGADPRGGVTLGSDGNFYGTCYAGGKFGTGTIWQLTPQGSISVLWDFRNGTPLVTTRPQTEQEKLDAAGSYPTSPPVQAKDGSLYGVSSYANNQQAGVLYRIGTGGGYHGIYMFNGTEAGALGIVASSVTAGSDGNLYGTTVRGGLGWGTVFKATAGGKPVTLHKFDAVSGQAAMSVIQGKDGALYGTASGLNATGFGMIYRLDPATNDYKILHTFNGNDGAVPTAGLTQGKDGFLYGATRGGGSGGRGTVFRIAPNGDYFCVIHSLTVNLLEGRYCYSPPILHSNGYLYGVSGQGGSHDAGVVYRVEMVQPDFVYGLNWWMDDTFNLYGPNTPSVTTLFTECSNRGVQVRAMLWDQYGRQNTPTVNDINKLFNGAAILDNRTLDYGSHHQKILVVNGPGGLTAWCGGVDFNRDRVAGVAGDPGSRYHDVHCMIKGPATKDLLQIFVDRWTDHPDHTQRDTEKMPLAVQSLLNPVPIPGATCTVQIGRTFGNGTRYAQLGSGGPYRFAPNGEHTAGQMIINGINHAKKFIYVEEQYFVDTAPNIPGLDVRGALVNKLKDPNFQKLIVVIPHGSITDMGASVCGVAVVKNQVNYRRRLLISALKAAGGDKVQIFYLNRPGDDHTYVHSKVWIFDDQFAIIGSANCNRRSWTHDSEVVAGVCDQGKPDGSTYLLPHRLRMRLWAEHLALGNYVNGVLTGYEDKLSEPIAGFKYWVAPPAGLRSQYSRILPYDNIVSEPDHSDSDWNKYVDPDGS